MTFWRHAFAFTCVALAACGGSDSETLTLSGTAATGAALAEAKISAHCAAGSGSTTAGTDGSFTLRVNDGKAPCVLRATSADGQLLHSITLGIDTHANITPVTEMVVARFAGQPPTDYYAAFDADLASTATTAAVQLAVTATLDVLNAAGLDTAAIGHPITSALVASSAASTGDSHDQVLDALGAKIAAAELTLADLVDTMIAAAPANAAKPSAVPAVAAEVMLNAKASDCAALRSGRYLRLDLGGLHRATTMDIDATSLTMTNSAGLASDLTPVDGQPCRYADGAMAGGEIVVAGSGVVFGSGANQGWIAFAKQAITLKEISGDWIKIGRQEYAADSNYFPPVWGFATFEATGNVSIDHTENIDACCEQGSKKLQPRAGGFEFLVAGERRAMLYPFRAGGGEMMLVETNATGFAIWRRERANSVPPVHQYGIWSIWNSQSLNDTPTWHPIYAASVDIARRDPALGTYARRFGQTLYDTYWVNDPKDGFDRKTEIGVVDERYDFYTLPLPGIGLDVRQDYGNLLLEIHRP